MNGLFSLVLCIFLFVCKIFETRALIIIHSTCVFQCGCCFSFSVIACSLIHSVGLYVCVCVCEWIEIYVPRALPRFSLSIAYCLSHLRSISTMLAFKVKKAQFFRCKETVTFHIFVSMDFIVSLFHKHMHWYSDCNQHSHSIRYADNEPSNFLLFSEPAYCASAMWRSPFDSTISLALLLDNVLFFHSLFSHSFHVNVCNKS